MMRYCAEAVRKLIGGWLVWHVCQCRWWPCLFRHNYIRIYKKIANVSSCSSFCALCWWNVRLKPHPPAGVSDVCLGSSVIVVQPLWLHVHLLKSNRYIIFNIQKFVAYLPFGGTAYVNLNTIDQTQAELGVVINYPTSLPLLRLEVCMSVT